MCINRTVPEGLHNLQHDVLSVNQSDLGKARFPTFVDNASIAAKAQSSLKPDSSLESL